MTCPRHPSPGFRLRRCGCASWSRSTTPPNPRRDTRRKRRQSSHANGRKDKPQEHRKTLTKRVPEIPLELRAKTHSTVSKLTRTEMNRPGSFNSAKTPLLR